MSGVQTIRIGVDEGDQRIDRWLKKKFPQLTQGAVEKMCRTGQLRVDGGRVKANTRVEAGQEVRVPPLPDAEAPAPARAKKPAHQAIRCRDDPVRDHVAGRAYHRDEQAAGPALAGRLGAGGSAC
jgi:23S rRNA-/tRNA-specific pseudouridylate synthase